MKKLGVIVGVFMLVMGGVAFTNKFDGRSMVILLNDSLRILYAQDPKNWPAPWVDAGVDWEELGLLPRDSNLAKTFANPKVILGKTLFFDPRLSGSNQISCASCHEPDLSWGDGRTLSIGHDHLPGTRNTNSLLNIGLFKELFWDGRSKSLEDQAINPIATLHEMNQEPPALGYKLSQIEGYKPLFEAAYGDAKINLDRIVDALATFQRTIRSRKSRFDEFLEGRYTRMTDLEIEGLHLFRTKARCINCHNGPLMSDQKYHNLGLTYYGRKYEDLGRYLVTEDPQDVGKFRTPSLRDVMRTRPWMHNGLFDEIEGILNMYIAGMPQPRPTEAQKNDPLFPKTDTLLKPLDINQHEKKALMAFLEAITASPVRVERPTLPK